MIHFRDATKDNSKHIEDMVIGETFLFDEDYYIVVDTGTNDNVKNKEGWIMCFCLTDAVVYSFDKRCRAEVVDVECVIK